MSRGANLRACTLPLEGMREALRLAAEDGETVLEIVAEVPTTARGTRPLEIDGVPIRYVNATNRKATRVAFHLEVKP